MDKRVEDVLSKLEDVRAYRGHELFSEFVALLGLIDESYHDDLRSASPESIRFKQGASRQCDILRESLMRIDQLIVPKV